MMSFSVSFLIALCILSLARGEADNQFFLRGTNITTGESQDHANDHAVELLEHDLITSIAKRMRPRDLNLNPSSASASTSASTLTPSSNWIPVPSVSIAKGRHKYVLMSALEPSQSNDNELPTHFVTSRTNASYHKDAAEPYVALLQRNGYRDIRIKGGGRIYMCRDKRIVEIFGHSYGFGRADHDLSKSVVEADESYSDYTVTWSNEGY
mmetsp:Transcript_3742/g.5640  ORF Transcript_3742/g.5640 Transcript_3742/m.5640 type:complete len:210 (+) Transcript_3742:3-632(+)